MIHTQKIQLEIDMQTIDFMHVVECLREPNHECCAYNDCKECVGEEF